MERTKAYVCEGTLPEVIDDVVFEEEPTEANAAWLLSIFKETGCIVGDVQGQDKSPDAYYMQLSLFAQLMAIMPEENRTLRSLRNILTREKYPTKNTRSIWGDSVCVGTLHRRSWIDTTTILDRIIPTYLNNVVQHKDDLIWVNQNQVGLNGFDEMMSNDGQLQMTVEEALIAICRYEGVQIAAWKENVAQETMVLEEDLSVKDVLYIPDAEEINDFADEEEDLSTSHPEYDYEAKELLYLITQAIIRKYESITQEIPLSEKLDTHIYDQLKGLTCGNIEMFEFDIAIGDREEYEQRTEQVINAIVSNLPENVDELMKWKFDDTTVLGWLPLPGPGLGS